ncbi:hypothetical protein ACG873_07215 [Mesorhizobium sp. AaZ16]|uniref:hypothetical protein n=1 Tax=Mesorhizobium sp. AaZ16 TaxID=3402289 RepID=UPI00374E752D
MICQGSGLSKANDAFQVVQGDFGPISDYLNLYFPGVGRIAVSRDFSHDVEVFTGRSILSRKAPRHAARIVSRHAEPAVEGNGV